jgi:hypothetical protein
MSAKPNFAAGLKSIKQEKQAELLPETIPPAPPPAPRTPSRVGKVAISGYFEEEVRVQLAIMAARQRKSQVELMAEALNLLFEKHGESPIARA